MKKLVLAALFLVGCTTPFYKEVDGTSTILGVSLPDEQYIQINALSYLGGQKTTIKEPCKVVHKFESCSTNDYFGIVHTKEWRKSEIELWPTNAVNEAAQPQL